MKDLNEQAFMQLFKEVCRKCFGHTLTQPLSETDSKLLASKIFEQTGLVIGVKSIKNYSNYILSPLDAKKENPSAATLDTLARYVLNAPETDELQRKSKESHFPYWFEYRNGFTSSNQAENMPGPARQTGKVTRKKWLLAVSAILVVAVAFFAVNFLFTRKSQVFFTDDFNSVATDTLEKKGWIIKQQDGTYWNRRHLQNGHLTLFTLVGDNWPDTAKPKLKGIKNLLVRKIDSDCFSTEIHLTGFVPNSSWQQAGILLAEDSTFTGKALRLSIGYNDFFGGYSNPAEVLIQAVGSVIADNRSKPEEIAHVVLFSGNPQKDSLIAGNLSKSALKIEKKGTQYRFLYSTGKMENFAFKEAARGDFSIQPRYIGIFAMQGYAETEKPLTVSFDSFSLFEMDCSN
ncbi:hypothetical protein [Foetidibacter luteolus]|uniref:hypothetical protein n=1 Tax=Foetidibacter luteolus TaxID=2608880 RepID=UPI00129BCD2E|nr:hypothetical protein [Foetidibacter luteolus]